MYVACQRCPVLNRPVAESWLYLACFARNRVTTAACLHALNRLRAEVDTDDANVGVDVQQRHRCAASPAADVQERARATGATQVLALKLRKRLCNVVPACVQFTSTGRTPASRPCEFIGNAHAHLGLKKRASWQEKNRSQYAPASFSSSCACLPRISCSRGSNRHQAHRHARTLWARSPEVRCPSTILRPASTSSCHSKSCEWSVHFLSSFMARRPWGAGLSHTFKYSAYTASAPDGHATRSPRAPLHRGAMHARAALVWLRPQRHPGGQSWRRAHALRIATGVVCRRSEQVFMCSSRGSRRRCSTSFKTVTSARQQSTCTEPIAA